MRRMRLVVGLLGVLAAVGFKEGEHTGTVTSSRLYTPPDAGASGGISAWITHPEKPIKGVFAMPQDDPKRCYKGQLIGTGHEIRFTGLPVGKYDLMVLYDDEFYEGFVLTHEDDSLTKADKESIASSVKKSVPFFDTKEIHRLAGVTGQSAKGRCVLQELRTKLILTQNADVMNGMQIRSIKLVMVEEVGAGHWQLVQTREIVRTEVASNEVKGVIQHHYNAKLGGIRVVDSIKNLGQVNLSL